MCKRIVYKFAGAVAVVLSFQLSVQFLSRSRFAYDPSILVPHAVLAENTSIGTVVAAKLLLGS